MTPKYLLNKGIIFFTAIFLLILLFSSFAYVPVGYRGVATRIGAITGQIRNEGISFKIPFIDGNRNIEVRVQKEQTSATAASRDLQVVTSVVALNYSIDPTKVVTLYQNVGLDYNARLLSPAIQESVKSTTAQFTADQLITKRAEVSDNILAELANKLSSYGIMVVDLNIVDFDFSDSFNKAIEDKVSAEQQALAAKNKLEQVKYEAEQQIESAKGRAEALDIEGQAISSNPQVVELRAVEKWNGVLPQYMSGNSVPFIQIP